jgi:hypothetical protein
MPNVIVTVSSVFGKKEMRICFRNSHGVISMQCGEHPMTYPFKGAELNTNDLAKLMRFFLESMENDDEKGNLERFEGSNA